MVEYIGVVAVVIEFIQAKFFTPRVSCVSSKGNEVLIFCNDRKICNSRGEKGIESLQLSGASNKLVSLRARSIAGILRD